MVDIKREGMRYDEIDLRLKQLQGWEGRTGVFEDAAYPNGTKVATVAAAQELGVPAKNIPARAAWRPAAKKNEGRWRAFVGRMAKMVLAGTATAQDTMEALASLAAEDVKQAISEVFQPPLKERTLAARRAKGNMSDKPLVDTKLLIRSVQGRAYEDKK